MYLQSSWGPRASESWWWVPEWRGWGPRWRCVATGTRSRWSSGRDAIASRSRCRRSSGTAGARPRCATAMPSSPGSTACSAARIPTCWPICSTPGATEMRIDREPAADHDRPVATPDDEELVMLACRRTTFEWVLRRSVLASERCTIRDGVAVDGLPRSQAPTGVPVVTGVVHERGRRSLPTSRSWRAAGACDAARLARGDRRGSGRRGGRGHRHRLLLPLLRAAARRGAAAARRADRRRPRLPEVRDLPRRQRAPSRSRSPRRPTTATCATALEHARGVRRDGHVAPRDEGRGSIRRSHDRSPAST